MHADFTFRPVSDLSPIPSLASLSRQSPHTRRRITELHLIRPTILQPLKDPAAADIPLRQLLFTHRIRTVARLEPLHERGRSGLRTAFIVHLRHECAVLVRVEMGGANVLGQAGLVAFQIALEEAGGFGF